MLIKFPRDDNRFSWTRHIKNKMVFYGLSEQKIRSVLNSPNRKEEGIAPNTTAVMKRNDRGKKKEEIWVMFQETSKRRQATSKKEESSSGYTPALPAGRLVASGLKKLLISAWRYPGVSKSGKAIPIPEDILSELEKII